MNHLVDFVTKQKLAGITIKPIVEEGRSPFLIVDVAALASADRHHPGSTETPPELTCLMYGHLDKQPYGEGWLTDPCDPVIKEDGKLYGRGSSDDGYAFFTAVLSIKAC
jgi:acetylornithine deacetylase/succinyl-diaminopimelate desuccinylase-like protein